MKDKLVEVVEGKAATTSRIVAEYFNRDHNSVMRAVRNLSVPEDFALCNFAQSSYTNGQGKSQPEIVMSRDGFTVLVMGFTGKDAMEWKLKYLEAFNAMEAKLAKQVQDIEWKQARLQGKAVRKSMTDVVKTFVEYATSQGSKSAAMYYMNLTKMEYAALNLLESTTKVPDNFRDSLDQMQINMLVMAENQARRAFEIGMEKKMPYKEIYQYAKAAVISYADGLKMPLLE